MRPMPLLLAAATLLASTRAAWAQPPASAELAAPPASLAPVAAEAPSRFRKPGFLAAGIPVSVLGAALIAGGVGVIVQGQQATRACYATGGEDCGVDTGFGNLVGGSMVGSGILHVILGVAFIGVGSERVRPAAQLARAVPTVAAGPRAVTLRWAF